MRKENKHEPLQRGGDVLQAEEIEVAGEVVAEHPEEEDGAAVRCHERHALLAPHPPGEREEERGAEEHAKGEERERVDTVAERELHDDCFPGKGDGGESHHHHAGEMRPRVAGPRRRYGHEFPGRDMLVVQATAGAQVLICERKNWVTLVPSEAVRARISTRSKSARASIENVAIPPSGLQPCLVTVSTVHAPAKAT